MSDHLEIELKLDVDPHTPTPDLRSLPGVAVTVGPIVEHLDATYFDTDDLVLAENRITLRRRTGGHDDGWHLKRPGTDLGRRERQAPLGTGAETTPPPEIVEPVTVHLRGRSVAPIAVINTVRHITELRGDDHRLLAMLCADQVTARSLLTNGTSRRWAEWEFELVDGDAALLAEAENLLRAAGARTASSASKLARAIGATPTRAPVATLGKKASALEVVITELRRHRDQLIAVDPTVRDDEDDAVHQMRVATRRLRSVLRAFPQVIGGDQPTRIDDELRELAAVLGVARDAEVAAARYRTLLADEDPSPALTAALVDEQMRRYRRGLKTSVAAMNSSRYFALLDDLDAMIAEPTPGPDAATTAAAALHSAVRSSRRSVRRAERRLAHLPAGTEEWTTAMHAIRKKAKRLRYVAESGAAISTTRHRRIAGAAKTIQSTLGDVNDAALSRAFLAAVTARTTDPRDSFVLGRLDAREQAAHDAALQAYVAVSGELLD
ncbi:CYTH and CHAD domain-containing protein [Williamsia sp. CHRR-6]|uniref:CYTH and CHAD domain-containing protein n=1 Tax=Williamsia sp. CHRR-6 TaxID=2835871 RepID=UPI001BDB321F|nr:CYTH and CHAD domain-containing protein [Williamsia sp. CHRR-6]MBT0565332.1 CYTH and CHAD domain-containing protein [Williamsia sp. CHRR-6]